MENPSAPGAVNSCKVFVGGLAPQTTNESLKAFFEQYGPVKEVDIKYAQDMHNPGMRRSRGFGFVTFEHENVVHDVVAQAPMMIEDKKCDVKRIEEGHENSKSEVEQRKIFVGGLPDSCDQEKLRSYFSSIDPALEDAKVMMDPQTGRSRRFGFVVFSAKDFVQKAVSLRDTHYIDGKWVDVHATAGKGKGKGGKPGYGQMGQMGKGFGGKGFGKHAVQQYAAPAYAPQYAYADPNAAAYAAYGAYAAAPAYGAAYAGYAQQPAYAAAPGAAPGAAAGMYVATAPMAAPYADPNAGAAAAAAAQYAQYAQYAAAAPHAAPAAAARPSPYMA